MADKKMLAQQVYQTVCAALEDRDWNFEKEESDLLVHFGVRGDDIPIQFIIAVDEERQLIRVMSPLPFKMSEDNRVEGAIAVCAANFGMVDGSFDYDLTDGRIVFRMTVSFRESTIGQLLIQYMISCTIAMVDEYNDKFLALNSGVMKVEDFFKKD